MTRQMILALLSLTLLGGCLYGDTATTCNHDSECGADGWCASASATDEECTQDGSTSIADGEVSYDCAGDRKHYAFCSPTDEAHCDDLQCDPGKRCGILLKDGELVCVEAPPEPSLCGDCALAEDRCVHVFGIGNPDYLCIPPEMVQGP